MKNLYKKLENLLKGNNDGTLVVQAADSSITVYELLDDVIGKYFLVSSTSLGIDITITVTNEKNSNKNLGIIKDMILEDLLDVH